MSQKPKKSHPWRRAWGDKRKAELDDLYTEDDLDMLPIEDNLAIIQRFEVRLKEEDNEYSP